MQTAIIEAEQAEWYQALVEECKAIITEGIFNSRWALVEMYHQLGERIITDENYQKAAKGNYSSLQGLAKNIGISPRSIYYACEFYEKYPELETVPEGKNISWNKILTKYLPDGNDLPHVSFNSGNNEWYTPPEYIEAAQAVLGTIDLDPASSTVANKTVQAKMYYSLDDDGLSKDWFGRVWMNPPYSSELIGGFAEKLELHYLNGDIPEAIVLVNNATETTWFQTMLIHASAVCFIRGRVKFIDVEGNPTGAPLQGQVILYLGNKPEVFYEYFSDFGIVLHGKWRERQS